MEFFVGVVDRVAVFVIDLRPAGEAGFDDVAKIVKRNLFLEIGDKLRPFGAGADEAHLAPEDIDDLGQFVDAGVAEEFPYFGDAVVIFLGEFRAIFFGINFHCAEFYDSEFSIVFTDSFLAVENRAVVLIFNCSGDKWAENDRRNGQY